MKNEDDLPSDDLARDQLRADEAQAAFVQRLRNLPLSESASSNFASSNSSSTRDRLIYECGFAAGVESGRKRQTLSNRLLNQGRYRQLAIAATLLATVLGGYVWLSKTLFNQTIVEQPSIAVKDKSIRLDDASKGFTTEDLAAVWVAVQNRLATAPNRYSSLTPTSQSIDAFEAAASTTSNSSEQTPTQAPLRSKDINSVLNWEV